MQKVDLTKIRKLREQKKITQKELAERLGYKTAIGYHYLEKGRCKMKPGSGIFGTGLHGFIDLTYTVGTDLTTYLPFRLSGLIADGETLANGFFVKILLSLCKSLCGTFVRISLRQNWIGDAGINCQ